MFFVRQLRGQCCKSLLRHRCTRIFGMEKNSILSPLQRRCANTSPENFLGAIDIDETRTYVRVRNRLVGLQSYA